MMKELLKQLWTIPNMLTLLRIIAVPFIMWCTLDPSTYIECGEYTFPIIGLVIMIAAASTDLVDGYIARHFNQGSQLGEMIDPLADKLMHCAAVLSLVIIGYVHWAFIVILLAKEATMVVGGIFMAGDSKNIKANYMGKVASATLSLAIVMSYFHAFWADKVFYLDWIVLGIGLVLTYIAFFNYLKQAIDIIKGILARKKAAKEGAQTESAETDDAVAVVADKDEAEDTAVGEKNINAASDKEN
ncbi:MAG: CDP-diacylglycerol--glycerol-3-phosphate 3-phosphatidyltransferase [Firmicutes bacterium]|uniref:CDP-diacylglycerol--glycerol-3-phosphate 3-phosphatidyltransferase n=1 Tax=Candidatus Stercoripulliclostridium pullicola TaxID=2840953 RepID=A0A940DHE2_9FIRM|nr:CDP-diacylglycerol--glycerol-3-phosphate 3-phosphatidyltransferase [Candidatus Stercoripulliclostridium pullicola]